VVWQDWVFAISGFILGASLIPTIRGDDKPALSTGILTTAIVTIVSITMATLGLWLAAGTNVLIVLGWATITVQKYRQIRRAHIPVIDYIEEEIVDGIQEGDEEELATARRN
jgi:hypothetical protein